MSIFGISNSVSEDYIMVLMNSKLISYYVDSFINNTQTFQINDARQLPVIIPSAEELIDATKMVNLAINIRRDKELGDNYLHEVQQRVDVFINDIYHL